MTISSENRKAGPYVGNGVATSFPFTFKVFEKSDLALTLTSPGGTETALVLDSDYSITLNLDQNATPGGTINYPLVGSPLPIDWRLTGVGSLQLVQETDITNGGGFYPQVIEDALDRNVVMIQQVDEKTERAVRVPASDSDTSGLELPASGARSDKVLGFDANGNFTVYDIKVGTSVGTVQRNKFVAGAGQSLFVTSFSFTTGVDAVHVFHNGAKLALGDDYAEGINQIILTFGASAGDAVSYTHLTLPTIYSV